MRPTPAEAMAGQVVRRTPRAAYRASRRHLLQGAAGLGLALALPRLLVGCAATVTPAPRQTRIPRLGYLSAVGRSPIADAFEQGLRERGYVDGESVAIEYRWGDGRETALPEMAEELVRAGVDVIVATSTPAALAAKNATSTIPIVIPFSADPVGAGLVANLSHPGAT